MRRLIKKLFIVVFAVMLLAGCRDKSVDKQSQSQQPKVVFRLAMQVNPVNKGWYSANLIREELERQSNGRIKVMFYDSGVLGAERQLVENCYFGVVEMVYCTSSVITTIDPVFSLLDMPYLFINEQHHLKVMNGPIGQSILDGLTKHKLQGIAFYSCGFRNIFNTKGKEIRQPGDLSGMKIRVMESPVMIDSINAMGASATPLSSSEVFQSLKTGVVDGAENNPQLFVSDKMYEADCRNFSLTRHFANQMVLIVNYKWYEKLKKTHPDLYELIREVPKQIREEYNRYWNTAIEESMKEMKERGVTVNEVDDIAAFIESVEPVYDRFFKKNKSVPRSLVDRIRKEASE